VCHCEKFQISHKERKPPQPLINSHSYSRSLTFDLLSAFACRWANSHSPLLQHCRVCVFPAFALPAFVPRSIWPNTKNTNTKKKWIKNFRKKKKKFKKKIQKKKRERNPTDFPLPSSTWKKLNRTRLPPSLRNNYRQQQFTTTTTKSTLFLSIYFQDRQTDRQTDRQGESKPNENNYEEKIETLNFFQWRECQSACVRVRFIHYELWIKFLSCVCVCVCVCVWKREGKWETLNVWLGATSHLLKNHPPSIFLRFSINSFISDCKIFNYGYISVANVSSLFFIFLFIICNWAYKKKTYVMIIMNEMNSRKLKRDKEKKRFEWIQLFWGCGAIMSVGLFVCLEFGFVHLLPFDWFVLHHNYYYYYFPFFLNFSCRSVVCSAFQLMCHVVYTILIQSITPPILCWSSSM